MGEVKSKVDIVDVIRERMELKKAGRNYRGLCPFHGEKTPSLMVSPELQIYKCFGCGESGDVLTFLMKYDGLEFPEALGELAERAGVKLKPMVGGAHRSEKQEVVALNTLAAKLYRYLLQKHVMGKEGMDYLIQKRELKKQTIEAFELGYAPNKPDVLSHFLKKKGIGVAQMERAGLVIRTERGVIDRFRGRVIFPIKDQRGQVVALGGRVLPVYETKNTGKYINSPETLAYHKSESLYGLSVTKAEIRKAGKVIVVEGELDLLSSWQAGVANVVAIKGSALTTEQARIISRFTSEVTLALDSDFAGDAAAMRGIGEIQKVELDLRVARMGKYKDPDDFSRADPEGYKRALKNAIGVWDFMIEVIMERAKGKSGSSKAKVSRELVPILASITDRIVQSHYMKKVADRLGVPYEAVSEQVLAKSSKEINVVSVKKEEDRKERTNREVLETRLLAIVFQEGLQILTNEEWKEYLTTPLVRKILSEYREYMKKTKKFEVGSFFESLPEELRQGFMELYLGEVELEQDNVLQEVEKIKKRLWGLETASKMDELAGLMAQYEKARDRKRLAEAQKEFARLSRLRAEADEREG